MKRKVRSGPTQVAAEVERLKAEGKMPSLERLLLVIAETRRLSVPQLLSARTGRTKRSASD
jgi:hypothetical protein